MGWAESSAARTRAAVSKATAEVAELNKQLSVAKARLALVAGPNDALERVAASRLISVPGMSSAVSLAQAQTLARAAAAQAKVDELQADLESAQNRLSLAQMSANAVERITSDDD